MKLSLKIFIAVLVCCAVTVLPSTAFPGIHSYLPDASGQYVYYRDYSFEFEAYIGFLYYDEATYAMRFFSPQYPVQNAPARAGSGRSGFPKSIDILFTVNPNVDYTELTGERFLSNIEGDDTEIVNYLHDLVYEFSARRRNLDPKIVKGKAESKEDFSQFGGMVTMEYSFDVPIFNLSRITGSDGNTVFDLVTVGSLVSSDDQSFFEFKDFPFPMRDKQRSFFSGHKKPNAETKYKQQKVLLDDQWTQAAENMFLLGDVAVLVMSDFSVNTTNTTTKEILDSFCRNFSLSSQGSYADWSSRKVNQKSNNLKLEILYWLTNENAVSRDFKIIDKSSADRYSVFSLTVFDNAYNENKEYFDSIVRSYKN